MRFEELEALPPNERTTKMLHLVRVVWSAHQLLQSLDGTVGAPAEAEARITIANALDELGLTRGVTAGRT